MSLSMVLAVTAGGFVGAPARYLLDRLLTGRIGARLPWGTMVVNVSGSLVLGLVSGLAMAGHCAPVLKAMVGTGFCGAFSTFSTFSFETLVLAEDGRTGAALANVALSLVVGLAAAGGGLAIGLAT